MHDCAGLNLHKCSDCEKSFKGESALKIHIKTVHEGHRVPCPICQKPLSSKTDVKRHVHEKKKPHSCDICNESFAQRAHLVTHKKGKHKNII